MVSIEQQIANLKEAMTGKVAPEAIATIITEGKTIEERLSRLQTLAKTQGIRESRVKRNNGSGINESAATTLDERISRHMEETGASYRESHIFLTGNDCGANKVQPKSFTESLAEKWRKYAPFLIEAEVQQLASRGVQP